MSLCPEARKRAAMSDGEFWEHVLRTAGNPVDPNPDDEPLDFPAVLDKPCPECGASGACAYDSEGRPLIHAGSDET